ncbi:MAG: glycoside hydrolase [Christensenellaceae bacterium]|nr:glycoside hydrolase [Christensenellaceae bacterium]
MKLTVKNISGYKQTDTDIIFFGECGKIIISRWNDDIYRFSWRFDNINIKDEVKKASDFMIASKQDDFPVDIKEKDEHFEIKLASSRRICIEKESGLISVYEKNKLLHGGTIGSKDLVVPSSPLRVIKKGDSLYAKYNFRLEEDDAFYGLGDKTGVPNRRGKRYQMFNRDALGYDAENSDPLYKSIPFFIRHIKEHNRYLGVFFPQPCIKAIDFGKESHFYYSVSGEEGPFDYFIIIGKKLKDIVANYAYITGLPALPPLYSFGFLGSSMNYLEADDAQSRVLKFFERTEKEDIPCEGMYFSSGYLKAPDSKRYAFLWNKEKFPNYQEFLKGLKQRGYHLIMNIKPGILLSHPWYEDIAGKGYFIKDAKGNPYVEYYWGGAASFIDFSNPKACQWWKESLKKYYFDHGCEGIWNDNNELELEDSELPAYYTRSVYPVMMSKASFEELKTIAPDKRPYVYSRSGSAGIQRYARTWTGDNRSDYKSLHFNQYMGLSLSLSSMPFYGHDIGGFFGNMPEEELLIRSSETAVFQMRFVIHSWNSEGEPTEPWTYKGALPIIRSLIIEHYRFMPYTYSCAIRASLTGEPVESLLAHEFRKDTNIQDDDINYMFGPFVLKLPVTSANAKKTKVYLPKGEKWYDTREDKLYSGGQTINKSVPMDGKAHYMLRSGAIIPTWENVRQLKNALWDSLTIYLLPPYKDDTSEFSLYEDDGVTELELNKFNRFDFYMSSSILKIKRKKYGLKSKEARKATLQLLDGYVFTENNMSTFEYDPDNTKYITLGIKKG